jgi:hypothetical protein
MEGSQNSKKPLNVKLNVDNQHNDGGMAVSMQMMTKMKTLMSEQAKEINLLLTTLNNVRQQL